MADSQDSKKKISLNPADKQEGSTEKRLLLAFALMGVVLLASQFLMPKSAPKQAPGGTAKTAQMPTNAPAQPTAPSVPQPAAANAPGAVSANAEQAVVIDNGVFRVAFSNQGATVHSWLLKKYQDAHAKPVELVSVAGAPTVGWPMAYLFRGTKPQVDLNKVLFVARQPDPLTVEFEYSDGRYIAKKSFKFEQNAYRVAVRSELQEAGQAKPHLLAWRGGFGDRSAHNAVSTMHAVHYDLSRNKLVVESAKDASDGPVTVSGNFSFAGLEDSYFAGVVLPDPGTNADFQIWDDKFSASKGAEAEAHVGAAFGGPGVLDATLFVGPKDLDTLRGVNPRLEQLVDWGWFGFIAKPLFLFLHWFNDAVTHNWGWAIVVVTIIINLLLLPLKYSSLRSMKKMSAIQPQVQALNEKYRGISMTDPRKQKQNEELMALYQKNGINPMGGCIPMLLQMPFFLAFYKVLSTAIELRGAQWMWVADLASPESTVIRVLPVAMLGTQVLMQKMTPATTGDAAQQKMMMFMMPVMMAVMFYSAPSGLVLYWLTGNVVGIFQQYAFNKMAPAAAPVTVTPKKK